MVNEVREIMRVRRDLYSFLSSLFYGRVTKDFVNDLVNGEIRLPEDEEINEGLRIMRRFVEERGEIERALIDIEDEFVRLLLGISEKIPVSKSELFGEGGYGKISLEVEEKMRKLGYVQINKSLPPDHIAMELDFMSVLIESSLDEDRDIKDCLKEQLEFLQDEMLSWIPEVLDRIEEKGEFFKGVAKLTRGFLRLDKKIISEILLW